MRDFLLVLLAVALVAVVGRAGPRLLRPVPGRRVRPHLVEQADAAAGRAAVRRDRWSWRPSCGWLRPVTATRSRRDGHAQPHLHPHRRRRDDAAGLGRAGLQGGPARRGLRRGRRDQRGHRPGAALDPRRRRRSIRSWRASRTTSSTSAPTWRRRRPRTRPSGRACASSRARSTRLEGEIDALNGGMAELTSFVLPGGSPAAAALHLARTVCRRAERACVALAEPRERQPGGAEVPQPAVGPAVRRRPLRQRRGARRRALDARRDALTRLRGLSAASAQSRRRRRAGAAGDPPDRDRRGAHRGTSPTTSRRAARSACTGQT